MNKKRVPLFIIGFIAAFILLAGMIVAIVFSSINKLQKADYYTLGEDSVPSVKYVVGERRIYSVSKSLSSGRISNTYRFRSDSAETDVYEYTKHLVEQAGFSVINNGQGNENIRYAKKSVEEGKIIVIGIVFTSSKYAITLNKREGSLSAE